MKLKNYVIVFATLTIAAGFSSCKKDSSGDPATALQATIELSGDQAISDNLNSDAESVLNEVAVDNHISGSRTTDVTQTMNILSCADVTIARVSATQALPFPIKVLIDFGSGCTSPINGVRRSGKIIVILSDSLRTSGSIATMTFDNYVVSGYKKEGTIIWTNTSQNGIKSWTRNEENGKVTAPDGHYWLHSSDGTVTQIDGSTTPGLLDDVFSVTGTATVTNSAGITGTSEITAALEKKVICENINKGTIKFQGPSHYAIIDFGTGDCDHIATISIDGSNPITFLLR